MNCQHKKVGVSGDDDEWNTDRSSDRAVSCSWEAGGDPGDPRCDEPAVAHDLCARHLAAAKKMGAVP